jgi:hypothetical protein
MTSAEEARGTKNLKPIFFTLFNAKQTDQRLILAENAKKSKSTQPYGQTVH